MHDAVVGEGQAVAGEEVVSGARVRQEGAEGEHVAGRAEFQAEDLLRGHVPGRTRALSRDRDPRRRGHASDAEVDQAGSVGGEQHVGRLEVPVYDPGRVEGGQGGGEHGSECPDGVGGEGSVLLDAALQGRPRHVCGGEPRYGGAEIGPEVPGHVPAAYGLDGLPLPAEADGEVRVAEQLAPERLDRGDPSTGAPQVDGPHAALTEHTEQLPGPER